MRLLLAASALVLLAGCSTAPATPSPSSSSSSAAPVDVDGSTYTIAIQGFPVAPLAPGATFNFTDVISGPVSRASDHIGAHFGMNHTDAPSTTIYNMTCVHQPGNLPGDYKVSCTAPMKAGTYYLRGHARVTKADGTQVSWWSDERVFTVAPA